jgi:hypothetical protein
MPINWPPKHKEARLALTVQEISKLRRIIKLAEILIENDVEKSGNGRAEKGGRGEAKTRKRRTGQELVRFRNLLKSERRKGVPVAKLARKHGVSTAYIYLLP